MWWTVSPTPPSCSEATVIPTARCDYCDCPIMDHLPLREWAHTRSVPLRYVWRVWWRHRILNAANKFLPKIEDTTCPF